LAKLDETSGAATVALAQGRGKRTPSLWALAVYVTVWTVSGTATSHLLRIFGLSQFEPLIVDGGIYAVALLLPLSYVVSPIVFSRPFWRVNRNSWKWILLVAATQAVVLMIGPNPAFHKLRAISAILVAPPVEEVERAVLICALVDRWGPFWGVAVTTFLDALGHSSPHLVVAQLLALSLMFVYSGRSIAANWLAHAIINVMAVAASGLFPTLPPTN
jgi:hypothetical protein